MMTRIKQAYKEDTVCAQVNAYCEHGWPPIMTENPAMRELYQVSDELSVEQGLLLMGSRIVIPYCVQIFSKGAFGYSQMQRDRPKERLVAVHV